MLTLPPYKYPKRILHKETIPNASDFDVECAWLCDTLNAIPGVVTEFSCTGHASGSRHCYYSVRVYPNEGSHPFLALRFITKAVDDANNGAFLHSPLRNYQQWQLEPWPGVSDLNVSTHGSFIRLALRLRSWVDSKLYVSEESMPVFVTELIRHFNELAGNSDWFRENGITNDPEAHGFRFSTISEVRKRMAKLRKQSGVDPKTLTPA